MAQAPQGWLQLAAGAGPIIPEHCPSPPGLLAAGIKAEVASVPILGGPGMPDMVLPLGRAQEEVWCQLSQCCFL